MPRRGPGCERRRASVPAVSYPPQLPVSARRDDLLAAIRDHQVVVVAGETGSGKTTQLPKLCLELGRGVRGAIAHTQPRRIAARTVAQRIADELDVPLGGAVGYAVRFDDRGSEDTLVRLVTDGLLLAEIRRDPLLRRYDTVIVDEAHERSLNIDFLLGCLHRILPRRPDLKLIITSATIDPERFSEHFGGAPIVEVSGRTYPVEVRYRPPREDEELLDALADTVEELLAERDGDVLAFFSGEREIRDAAELLSGRLGPGVEVLPLYSRLAAAEQQKVFGRKKSRQPRRVVLATNVAETSLTVPGIRFVVDTGLARISRYSARLKVQRLPIEPISRASADQRKGRCGRVADGICVRLYSEDDFNARPEFTDPEVLRTNLASVILQMAALGLGEVEAFPFLEPPDRRQVRDGVALLARAAGAGSVGRGAAHTARAQARAASDRPAPGSHGAGGRQARLRPRGDRHRRRAVDPGSTRASRRAARSGRPAPRPLHRRVVGLPRLPEPVALRALAGRRALALAAPQALQGRVPALPAHPRVAGPRRATRGRGGRGRADAQRRAGRSARRSTPRSSPGCSRTSGMKDAGTREYTGARGAKFAIFPGSVLARRGPTWVMVAELVETTRLWGRTAAAVDVKQVEPLAEHLVKRSYGEPRWDRRRAAVVAPEQVTLYGLPIVQSRTVQYGRIDPAAARELFIRRALVEGDWDQRHAFMRENERRVEEVEALEARARRRDLLASEAKRAAFFDERIPQDVVSGRHFDRWWKQARQTQPTLLDYPMEMLIEGEVAPNDRDRPARWIQSATPRWSSRCPTASTPARRPTASRSTSRSRCSGAVRETNFEWLVPAFRQELVIALLRTLPKPLRTPLVPIPDTAAALLAERQAALRPAARGARRGDRAAARRAHRPGDWSLDDLPAHLRMTFCVEDEDGTVLASGQSLDALRDELRPRLKARLERAAPALARHGMRSFDVDSLPRTVDLAGGLRGFPALVDEGDAVGIRICDSAGEQAVTMARGTRRLLRLTVPSPRHWVTSQLGPQLTLALAAAPHGTLEAAIDDATDAALDALIASGGGPAWDAEAFAALREHVRGEPPAHDARRAARARSDPRGGAGRPRAARRAPGDRRPRPRAGGRRAPARPARLPRDARGDRPRATGRRRALPARGGAAPRAAAEPRRRRPRADGRDPRAGGPGRRTPRRDVADRGGARRPTRAGRATSARARRSSASARPSLRAEETPQTMMRIAGRFSGQRTRRTGVPCRLIDGENDKADVADGPRGRAACPSASGIWTR